MANSGSNKNQFALLILAMLPVALYYSLFFACVVDAPVWDDYDAIFSFALDFDAAETVSQRLGILFSSHNEHRLVLLHLATLASLTLFGQINFAFLSTLGNIFLLFVAWLLCAAFYEDRRSNKAVLSFAPVMFLLFQPQYYDTLLWPTVLLSNFPVTAFALASFRALSGISTARIMLALFFAICALLSQTNGVCVLLIGALRLLPHYKRRELRTAVLLWFGASFAAIALMFALALKAPQQVAVGQAGSFSVWDYLGYFFGFIGSASADSIPSASVLFGCLLFVSGVFLWVSAPTKRFSSINLFLLFCLASILLNSLGRGELGLEYAVAQPRYKFLSILIVICLYLNWMQTSLARTSPSWLRVSLLSLSILFCGITYFRHAPKVIETSNTLQQGLLSWELAGNGLYYPVLSHAASLMQRSLEAGIYRVPAIVARERMAVELKEFNGQANAGFIYAIDQIVEGQEYTAVQGWGFSPDQGRLLSRAELLLERGDKLYVLEGKRVLRPDVAKHFGNPLMLGCGFSVLFKKSLLEENDFRLGVAAFNPYMGSQYILRDKRGLK